MFSWCLCDAPLLLFALLKAGVDYDKHIKQGVDYLVEFYRMPDFPCTVSQELGKFKGWDFGQKKNPSPYLTYLCNQILARVRL